MGSMKSIKIRNLWTGSVVFEYTKEIQSPKRFWKLLDAVLTCAMPTCAMPTCAVPTCAVPRDVIYHARLRAVSSVGKKASGHIVKLRIPEDARRSSATGHKCRCDKAYVMEIQNMDGTRATEDTVRSDYDQNFVYTVGATVEVPDFDDNRWSECAPGIHFFIDRREAVEF